MAGIEFRVEAADIDEGVWPGEAAAAYVRRLAVEKAQVVWERYKGGDDSGDPITVIGADTTVVCDGELLGKPVDQADARRMLTLLSGRTHQVLTGVAALTRKATVSEVEITQVFFDLIGQRELVRYLASGEPMDKAGAYGIQGYAARWIPRIEGCYFNVVGLPLARTLAVMARAQDGPGDAVPPL